MINHNVHQFENYWKYNRYAKAFSECSSTSDCDFLGRVLLAISQETGPGNTFELIKDLIAWEIHKYRVIK
jgi:hypothetical protein